MKQSLLGKARTKITDMLIGITTAIGATIAVAIGVPCIICYVLIENYKRHRDMKGIYRDIKRYLGKHRNGYDYEQSKTW